MPWIRLSDNYIDHPKFQALSDGSFRLWHEAMAFCRRHQSDGFFSFQVMRNFTYYTKSREKQLATPHEAGAKALWALIPGGGYRVHDYLEWNLSREEETNEKSGAAARMRKFRAKPESGDAVRYGVTTAVTELVTNAFVPDMDKDKKKKEIESASHVQTAARMVDAFKGAWKVTYGVPCVLDVNHLQRMRCEAVVGEVGEFKFLDCMRGYFASTDVYLVNAKHPLGLFLKEPTKYLATTVKARPRGCRHEPACADDVSHTARASRELREQAS